MSVIEVRQVENGYVLKAYSEDGTMEFVAQDKEIMADLVTSFFPVPSEGAEPPTPQEPDDAPEVVVVSGEPWPGSDQNAVAAPDEGYEPAQPAGDSGPDWPGKQEAAKGSDYGNGVLHRNETAS